LQTICSSNPRWKFEVPAIDNSTRAGEQHGLECSSITSTDTISVYVDQKHILACGIMQQYT